MARKQNRRVNSRSERTVEQYVIDGNTVRKIQAIPQEEPEVRPVRRTTSRNRARTRAMSRGYVMFLAVVSAGSSVYVCPLSADEVCDHDTDKGDCHCRVRAESAESRQ